jgi:hypothetical protein
LLGRGLAALGGGMGRPRRVAVVLLAAPARQVAELDGRRGPGAPGQVRAAGATIPQASSIL